MKVASVTTWQKVRAMTRGLVVALSLLTFIGCHKPPIFSVKKILKDELKKGSVNYETAGGVNSVTIKGDTIQIVSVESARLEKGERLGIYERLERIIIIAGVAIVIFAVARIFWNS